MPVNIPVPNPVAPGTNLPGKFGNVQLPTGILTPITGTVDFLRRLADKNLWIRIGEGMVGLLLISAGIFAITKNITPANALAKTLQSAGRKVF